MEANINPSAIGIALILMATASLFTMLSLNQINSIVHSDLYNYYLQFSYKWAMPYWIFSGVVFGLSWMNIALSIIIALYVFKKSRKSVAAEKTLPINIDMEEKQHKEENKQCGLNEFFESEKSEMIAPKERQKEMSSKEFTEEEVGQSEEILVEEQKEHASYQEATEETESSEESGGTYMPTDDEQHQSIL